MIELLALIKLSALSGASTSPSTPTLIRTLIRFGSYIQVVIDVLMVSCMQTIPNHMVDFTYSIKSCSAKDTCMTLFFYIDLK